MVKHPVSFSQYQKISEEANAEIMAMLASLSRSMEDVKGTVDNVGVRIEGMSRTWRTR